MERRMLLAVVLSILSVIAYSALTGRGCTPRPKDETPVTDGDTPPTKDGTGKASPVVAPPGTTSSGKAAPGKGDVPVPGVPAPAGENDPKGDVDFDKHPQRNVAASRATLGSTELEVVVTSQGGAIESVRLKGATEGDQKTLFDQIVPVDPTMLMGATDDTAVRPASSPGGADRAEAPAGPLRSPLLQWTRDEAAEQATEAIDAVYTFETPRGLIYTKRWIVGDGKHRFDLTLRLSARTKDGATITEDAVGVSMLSSSGHLREYVRGAFANVNDILWRLSSEADLHDENHNGIELQKLSVEGRNRERLEVFGMRTAYFLSMYYRVPGANEPAITDFWATGEEAASRPVYDANLATFWEEQRQIKVADVPDIDNRIREGVPVLMHCWMRALVPVQKGATAEAADAAASEFHFYIGPNERSIVRQDVYGPLDSIVTYPNAPDFVADILLWIYDVWLGLFGSAGLAVILMTVCVRGGLMPLSVRNQLSMRRYGRKVAKLKPKVAELQKKFASNPKKIRDEQMKLYREHGVGFPSGCLMMLIQIPIFFSLFSALRVEYTLRGAEFLWIADLAGPDRLVDFGSRVIDLGFFWVESINLLPILMVGLSIMHTRNMPKPADEQQAQQMKMMKWLPIVFAFILYNYTAALAIYMVLSSAVAIIESKIVRAKDEADLEEAAAAKG